MSFDIDQANETARAAGQELDKDLGPVVRGEVDLSSDELYAAIEHAQGKCLARLASTGAWGKANQLPSNEFWKIAGYIVGRGPLQLDARVKPHGYAGDYEMLDRISNWKTSGDPLEKAFDVFFQNQAAPRAVRNRTQHIAQTIQGLSQSRTAGPIKIVSVGSGPAADVLLAARQAGDDDRARWHVTLLDLDPHALAFAQNALYPLLSPSNVRAERINLFRLPRQRTSQELMSQSDLVFCSGLLDYLSANDAADMLRVCWDSLGRGGRVLAFNFATDNPSRAYMEWFGNWYLVYRTLDEMHELARRSGMGKDDFTVSAEPEQVNLFIEATKSNNPR